LGCKEPVVSLGADGASLGEVQYAINFNGLAFHWPTLEALVSTAVRVTNLPVTVRRMTASAEFQRQVRREGSTRSGHVMKCDETGGHK
jgi:hypothetical protein